MKKDSETGEFLIQYLENDGSGDLLLESHCHSHFELIAVLEGSVTLVFEGKKYQLSSESCALISPLAYHSVCADKRGLYRRITVMFDSDSIPEVLRPHFPDGNEKIYIAPFKEAKTVVSLAKELNNDFYEPLINSIMTRLFYEIIDTGTSNFHETPDGDLAKMLHYIDEHLTETVTLSDIASHVALSKSSVSHVFKERMNISPKQYILQKKLAYAAKLILEGAPATEAAVQIGYDNYSNFYRMYRKQFGENPTGRQSFSVKE